MYCTERDFYLNYKGDIGLEEDVFLSLNLNDYWIKDPKNIEYLVQIGYTFILQAFQALKNINKDCLDGLYAIIKQDSYTSSLLVTIHRLMIKEPEKSEESEESEDNIPF